MAKRKRRKLSKSQLSGLMVAETMMLFFAFVPVSRYGRVIDHKLFARLLVDEPGYIFSSLVNFVVINLLTFGVLAIAYSLTKSRRKKRR